jgi:trehalose 6-phosphate synthase/phosphatase
MLATLKERDRRPDVVLCIGDDRSDEDMFQFISSAPCGEDLAPTAEVFAGTVGRKPSKAKYYLDDTAEVVRLMQGLAYVSEELALQIPAEGEDPEDLWCVGELQ